MTRPGRIGRSIWGPLTTLAAILLVFLAAMAALSMATGMWPPLMAVESKSMQHNDTVSAVGVIDTGDVVVVDRNAAAGGIRTYLDSLPDGYQSFGGYGDVVVYQPPSSDKPIVHRAICTLVYNSTAKGFDMPELAGIPASMWSVPGPVQQWWALTDSVDLYNIGYANVSVHIDLEAMLVSMGAAAHGGLITMGDNNWDELVGGRVGVIDQGGILGVDAPIPEDWVIGKVTYEIPWVGTIRLWLTGSAPAYLPRNTVVDLFVALACVVLIPTILFDIASSMVQRGKARSEERRR